MAVVKNLRDAVRAIAQAGGARGFEVSVDEAQGRVVIRSRECPVELVVEPVDGGYRVELRVGEGLRECIEEMLNEGTDPRNELENILESLISVADFAVRRLENLGYEVKKSTRQGILDVYDAIESFLEEE
ncbi:MAG: hypothetical protein F7C34_02430 [Desulfurococcales archaeon]|nr:hypothetical protein [Desulfurococcales archaeon]